MHTFSTLLALAVSAAMAFASPTPGPITTLDVFVPPVIVPDAETVWQAGKNFNVTWDASNPPSQITNPSGRILLQRGCANPGEVCQNIGQLAQGFSILDGTVQITVPEDVTPADDYFVVLFGDSGNRSDRFEITA